MTLKELEAWLYTANRDPKNFPIWDLEDSDVMCDAFFEAGFPLIADIVMPLSDGKTYVADNGEPCGRWRKHQDGYTFSSTLERDYCQDNEKKILSLQAGAE